MRFCRRVVAAGQRHQNTAGHRRGVGCVHGVLEQFNDESVAVRAAGGVLLGVRVLAEPSGGCSPGVEDPALDRGRPERVVQLADGELIMSVVAARVVQRVGLGVAAVSVHDHVSVRLRVHRLILLFNAG